MANNSAQSLFRVECLEFERKTEKICFNVLIAKEKTNNIAKIQIINISDLIFEF